jgi:predicted phosphate transport protein (TIGR00153 family)
MVVRMAHGARAISVAHARYSFRHPPSSVPEQGVVGGPIVEMPVRLSFIPREERFFDLFAEDAANVLGGARLLEAMLRGYDQLPRRAGEIRDAEHRGDEISHDIGHRLESTFVTPFDREDIHSLISGLDDVLDLVEEVADTFVLYRIEAPTEAAIRQASIVVQQCELLHDALGHLRGFKDLERYWIEVHRLENEGDRVTREAIAGLFDGHPKALEVIKWKEIYTLLEATIDKCEDVANIIERIVLKHA